MLLITHILIALGSILSSSWLLFKPSRVKFILSYALIGLTLISGTTLVVVSHSPILPSCEAGLVYLFGISLLLALSYRRFNMAYTEETSKHVSKKQ